MRQQGLSQQAQFLPLVRININDNVRTIVRPSRQFLLRVCFSASRPRKYVSSSLMTVLRGLSAGDTTVQVTFGPMPASYTAPANASICHRSALAVLGSIFSHLNFSRASCASAALCSATAARALASDLVTALQLSEDQSLSGLHR